MTVVHKTKTRAIVLRGVEETISKELVAGGTITPGHLIQLNSAGQWVVTSVAGGRALKAFAVERDFVGDDIDTNYVANDLVQARICQPGCEINGLVPANAPAITAGDFLESNGDGTVRKRTADVTDAFGTPGAVLADVTASFSQSILNNNFASLATAVGNTEGCVAVALESLDNSAVGAPARLRFIVL